MKKIASILLGAAILFAFAGCANPADSGDDDGDNNTPATLAITGGAWWTATLDTTSITSDTVNIIFSNAGGGHQTADITGVAKTGVAYFEMIDAASATYQVSKRTDQPAATAGANQLVVYVYTDMNPVSIWCWDADDTDINVSGGSWPGVAMTSDSAEEVSTLDYTFNFSVEGLNDGDMVFVNGLAFGWGPWPFASWSAATYQDADMTHLLTANSSGITPSVSVSYSALAASQISFMAVTATGNATDGYTNVEQQEIPITAPATAGTYNVVMNFDLGTISCTAAN